MGIITFLAVFSGRNRTAADDQTIDFRMNQIMVKLNQIEWAISQVRNRLSSNDQRLADIDRQLDRVLEELGSAASTAPASSSTAIDPALVGTWVLSHNDFAEVIPNYIRRYFEELAQERRNTNRLDFEARREADHIESNIEDTVTRVLDGFEEVQDSTGLRLIGFRSDGMYTNSTEDEGMWLVSGNRLIMTTFDGRNYPVTYFVDGTDLTLTITGDQLGTLFKLKAADEGRLGRRGRDLIDNTFKYTDRVRLFYTKD